MPKTFTILIHQTALALLKTDWSGIRFKELHRAACERLPDVSLHTVASGINTLRHTLPPGECVADW